MQDETIHKLVTMLGDARAVENLLRCEAMGLRVKWERAKAEIAELEASLAQAKGIIAQQADRMREHDRAALDEDRLAPWEPIPDNVQGIACGTFRSSATFSTDDDGRLVKVESQGNSIIMDLRDMWICCRRGMWAPF